MVSETGRIDTFSRTANMYGCEPCPKCGSKYRAPFKPDGVLMIECDDCGFKEPGEIGDEYAEED